MRSVFLSYSRSDRPVVARIAAGMEAAGFDVWWDHELLSGTNYIVEINRRLRLAESAVVIWSATSIESEWVLSEAETARARGILKPLCLGDVLVPAPFNSLHSVTTDASPSDDAIQRACADLAKAIAGEVSTFVPAPSKQVAETAPFTGKRMLALDGCGARLPFQIGALQHVEATLRQIGRIGPDGVLADYFQIIGGTSSSAYLAALLSQGRSLAQCSEEAAAFLRATHLGTAPVWFGAKANNRRLRRAAQRVFAAKRLDDPAFRTIWLAPTRRLDKAGAEIFSNNPSDPLWTAQSALQLQRYPKSSAQIVDVIEAACASPPFFAPVVREIGPSDRGILVDVAAFNANPSATMYDYATRRDFGLSWPTGPDAIFLLSIGGGILHRQLNVNSFQNLFPILQTIWALVGNVEQSALETVSAFQERFDTPKPFFVRVSGGLIPGRTTARERLGRYQRIDAPLEYDYARHAFGVRMRKAQWGNTVSAFGRWDKSKFETLRDIGRQVAETAFATSDAV